jgi:hypothetical protein
MKSQHLIPALAAAIGFALAWAVKPGGSAGTQPATDDKPAAAKPTRNDSPRNRPSSTTGKRPKEVNAGDFPLADLADKGPKSRVEAKMLRLSEALDLSVEQQGQILSAMEEAKAAATDGVPVIQDLATRGKALEAALASILTPEQLAKFEELRVRERENRIESRAQRSLSSVIEEIDLSPGQRDEVLARLRQYAKEQVQSIPAAATLLLNTSMLPTESNELTVDGVLALTKISEEPLAPDNPMEAHQRVIQRQRQELEERLQCFDGILTPGQMGQVHAAIAEKRSNLEKLRELPAIPPVPEQDMQPEPGEMDEEE